MPFISNFLLSLHFFDFTVSNFAVFHGSCAIIYLLSRCFVLVGRLDSVPRLP